MYTLVVTPTAGFEGNVTVDVDAGAATDAAGNPSTAAIQAVQAVDMKAPTLTIADDEAAATANIAGGDITYTFTFAEAVTGFTADDVTVTNGSKGTFTAVSSTVYTLVVTPTAGFEGDVTVDVDAGAATDAAGNPSTAAIQAVQAVDMQAPTLTVSGVDISADTGTSATDFITKTAAQTVTGTLSAELESGDILYGSVDNGTTWTNITSKASGTAITWDGVTLSGSSSIVFKVADAAGNEGALTGTQAYVLDTTPPTTPTVTSRTTHDTTPLLSGTAEAGTAVTVSVGGASYLVTADGSGNWQLDTTTATPASDRLPLAGGQ